MYVGRLTTSQSLPDLLSRFSLPRFRDGGTTEHELYLLRFKRTTSALWDVISEDANANGLIHMTIFGRPERYPRLSIRPSLVMPVLAHWRNVAANGVMPNAMPFRLVCDGATRDRLRALIQEGGRCRWR